MNYYIPALRSARKYSTFVPMAEIPTANELEMMMSE